MHGKVKALKINGTTGYTRMEFTTNHLYLLIYRTDTLIQTDDVNLTIFSVIFLWTSIKYCV